MIYIKLRSPLGSPGSLGYSALLLCSSSLATQDNFTFSKVPVPIHMEAVPSAWMA